MKSSKVYVMLIVALAVIAPLFINILMLIPGPEFIAVGSKDTWVGFFGNYSGGIIGGLVAFFIMKIQLEGQKELEKDMLRIKQSPSLVKVKFLLEHINKNLKNVSMLFNEGSPMIINDDSWIQLNPVNQNYVDAIDNIINPKMQIDLMEISKFYVYFQQTLSMNITQKLNEFNIKDAYLMEALKNPSLSPYDIDELIVKRNEAETEIRFNRLARKDLWEEFKTAEWKDKINLLIEKVNKELDEINKI